MYRADHSIVLEAGNLDSKLVCLAQSKGLRKTLINFSYFLRELVKLRKKKKWKVRGIMGPVLDSEGLGIC